MARYSVVIPCYKSSLTVGTVVETTVEEFRNLGIDDFEFVLVNDCSPDEGKTREAIFRLAEKYPFVKAIDLGKNGGQHNATMAGLHYATGDFIISMDDDMQTRPSEIIKLKSKMDEGYDIVYGYYEQKKESLFRRMGSTLNHLTVCFLLQKPKWLKTSSFWIIRKYVRDYAIQYAFPQVHLQGVFLRVTGNIACVPINHFDREVGKSGYTLKKLIWQYFNIIGFSVRPLAMIRNLGVILASLSFVAGLVVLIHKLIHPETAVGWSSMTCLICFFAGVLLLAMGVIGNYLGKLYSGATRTPQYVVREVRNVPESENKEGQLS